MWCFLMLGHHQLECCSLSFSSAYVSMQHAVIIDYLLDPRPRPEGSYKIVSVCPSFCPSFHQSFRLSISFLGMGSLVFSETQHCVRGPYIVVCDSLIFWKKSHLANDKKWSKMAQKQHLDFLRKSCHQFYLEFV